MLFVWVFILFLIKNRGNFDEVRGKSCKFLAFYFLSNLGFVYKMQNFTSTSFFIAKDCQIIRYKKMLVRRLILRKYRAPDIRKYRAYSMVSGH